MSITYQKTPALSRINVEAFMGTTKGELEFAKRRALNLFDKWNDCTSFVPKFTGYYYELQGVIEDAVECGAQMASGVHEPLEAENG